MATRSDLVLPALRLAGPLLVLGTASSRALQVMASVALFFACFAAAHDLAHGALGLPRRANALALSVTALGMLVSGHAMRVMHLRHHARPLAADDLEGDGAKRTWWSALLSGPRNALALKVAAFRAANPHGRRRQVLEMGATVAVLALSTHVGALRVHVIVALCLQLTMAFWASYVPHNTPRWLADLCARLRFLRSPVLLSLALHDVHHAHPRVPCHRLSGAGCGALLRCSPPARG